MFYYDLFFNVAIFSIIRLSKIYCNIYCNIALLHFIITDTNSHADLRELELNLENVC